MNHLFRLKVRRSIGACRYTTTLLFWLTPSMCFASIPRVSGTIFRATSEYPNGKSREKIGHVSEECPESVGV